MTTVCALDAIKMKNVWSAGGTKYLLSGRSAMPVRLARVARCQTSLPYRPLALPLLLHGSRPPTDRSTHLQQPMSSHTDTDEC